MTYTYDAAHRLTDITDALGNRIHYTLDAAGNKTKEETFDASNTLRRSLARSYNTLGQLTGIKDGLNRTVFDASFSDSYDGNGNLVRSADALGIQRKQGYDALNRLVSTIDNYNGTDTATQNTQSVFAYGPRDELQGVSDPDSLNTTYDYDGLGNATGLHSPDTGTSTYVYDAAGNRIQATDARGVVSHSTYDALNRITATTYPTSSANVSYHYDEADSVTGCTGSHPAGRLTSMVETAVTTVYCYDLRGNVVQKRQTQGTNVDTVSYAYTLADRLASTRTPDGTFIQYGRDGLGRINVVTAQLPGAGSVGNVVTNVSYLPFGPIASYTLGNGQTITRSYDANYAVTDVVSPALNLHFARDAMGNITALGNASGANPAIETYNYDPLYRLLGLKDAQGQAMETYTYNKTGDRLSKASNGLATGTYGYQAGTHRLTSIGSSARTYDANGNTTGNGTGGDTFGYGYNDRNRMTVVQRNGLTVANYVYNAMGERVAKVAATNQRFAYDEDSQLAGEYGTTSRTYVWLDNLPVAMVDTNGVTSTVSYVHADALGTPRAITNSSGAAVWQWGYNLNPFGEKAPSVAGVILNLRFPGQYYDTESGLVSNGARYYCAECGRYSASDPSGLAGGMSTYAIDLNNPLRYFDPDGRQVAGTVNNDSVDWAARAHANDVALAYLLFGVNIDQKNPPGDDSIQTVVTPFEFMAAGKIAGGISAASNGICRGAGAASGLGDLTNAEVAQIQRIVNKAGRPLEIVGSAAKGTRRGVGSKLPVGKGPGTRSDIDYIAPPGSLPYYDGLGGGLPSIDSGTGIIPGSANPSIGPSIRFEPFAPPYASPGG
ncbi:RHS repeat protein [Dyella marensis]|uniref:RHS repeat-associated core domain-containing protein n=1 Tax=Dyella marensis TaxID=500610 RepID=UPI0031DBD479